jgi:SAM-dependent methyltransferase
MKKKTKQEKIKKIISAAPYRTDDATFYFLPGKRNPTATAGHDLLGKIQNIIKAYPDFYNLLVSIFAPHLKLPAYEKQLKKIVQQSSKNQIILNIGSGPAKLYNRTDIINLDIFAFPNVDIVADATALPIHSSSIDTVLLISLLEHVPNPDGVIQETHRVLKPGGKFFCYVPFIVPYHAAPFDYNRWTRDGLKATFTHFHNVKISIGTGPTSGMIWVFAEWLAICLSFGISWMHDTFLMLFMVLFSPLKLLDLFLWRFPHADNINSCYFIVGEK